MIAPKTYSFGVKFSVPIINKGMEQDLQDQIKKMVEQNQDGLLKSLFKNRRKNKGMSDATYEIVSCVCVSLSSSFNTAVPCEACGGRDRHPIPLSEFYSPGRLIET